MKMLATMMAGSLPKPASAPEGLSTPAKASARMVRTATKSFRIHSVRRSPKATMRITRKRADGSRPI